MKGEEFNFFTPEIRGSTEIEWDGGGLEVGIEARSWIIWRDVLAEVIGETVEKQRETLRNTITYRWEEARGAQRGFAEGEGGIVGQLLRRHPMIRMS